MWHHAPIRWNAYPALLLAGIFALGIWIAVECPTAPVYGWFMVVVMALGIAVAGHLWPRRQLVTLRPLIITLSLGVAVMGLGGARTAAFQHLPPGHIGHLLHPHAAMEGAELRMRVRGVVEHAPRGTRFTARLDTLVLADDTLSVHGSVRAFLYASRWETEASLPPIGPSDRIRLHARLEAPPLQRNPADFDYGAYLRRRGVHGVVTADTENPIHVVGQGRSTVWSHVAALRAGITHRIDRYVPGDEAQAVLRALLTGDRGRISDNIQERFAATGLLHLLAISGLHVLLVGMVLYTLLRPVLMRVGLEWRGVECVRAAITLSVLCGFALLTGGRASVVRAVVMAGLFIGGNVLQRRGHPLNTLGVAGLVILAAAPLSLFDAGFQLSFAAVGAIVTLNSQLQGCIPPRWRHGGWRGQLTALATTSVTATLGTMPVLLTHFGYVSFGGIALNVVAIPLTALALVSGMLTVALGGWALTGSAFGAAAGTLTGGLLETARRGEEWLGWVSVEGFLQDPWIALAIIGALVTVVQWPRPRLRWRLAATALLFAGLGTWGSVWDQLDPPPLEVVFLDVGQGDAAVVSLPNGQHMLVDAGARSLHFDAGASFVIPHLDRHGIDRLDTVVISHSDSDHLGGLPAILRHVPVGRVVLNDQEPDTELVEEVVRLTDSLHVPIQRAWAGDTLSLDAGVHVQVLSPPKKTFSSASDNDASVVLRLVHGSTRTLFTGDIEAAAERWLARYYGDLLQSEIVKVGHHGSRTSSRDYFIEQAATRGGTAVVSVGMRNRFGLPAPEVIRRWQAADMHVVLTAREGAIWFRSDGDRFTRVSWR